MNIDEAIAQVQEAPEGSVLVARPPLAWGADALFVPMTPDYAVPQKTIEAGYVYVLERDEILDLLGHLRTKRMSSRAIAEFILHYSLLDCAPAWIDDIPNR